MIRKISTIAAVLLLVINLVAKGQTFIFNALEFDTTEIPGFVPYYKHFGRNALAIDSGKFPNRWAAAEKVFEGENGVYEFTLVTLKEKDGEPTYRIRINGKLIGDYQHPYTGLDYEEERVTWKGIELKNGDLIRVESNNISNGLIPEGNGFAFARGRWTQLIIAE
jgi:hypothetical protein